MGPPYTSLVFNKHIVMKTTPTKIADTRPACPNHLVDHDEPHRGHQGPVAPFASDHVPFLGRRHDNLSQKAQNNNNNSKTQTHFTKRNKTRFPHNSTTGVNRVVVPTVAIGGDWTRNASAVAPAEGRPMLERQPAITGSLQCQSHSALLWPRPNILRNKQKMTFLRPNGHQPTAPNTGKTTTRVARQPGGYIAT